MSISQIAIVGRPNVGKSSLLNRLAGQRISIVDPTPGVTRDRVAALIEIDPPLETQKGTPARLAELVDTGGFGVYVADGQRFDDVGADLTALTDDIEYQIRTAMEQSALILFIIDAQAGITSLDETVATLLRRSGLESRVLVVANKVDSEKWEADAYEASALGLGQPLCVSTTSGTGVRQLLDAVYERLPGDDESGALRTADELKLAIVGKRNAGKSTLVNALAGQPRVIVSEIAGTTRDSIDVRFEIAGHTIIAIDTAGVRKRKSIAQDVEYYAWHRALRSIRRADVALFLIDATKDISQVDKKLSMELQRQFKPTVIVVNKWDLVDEARVSPEDYLDYLTQELRGLDYAPIVFISALNQEGLRDAIAMAFNLRQQATHRETTGQVNGIMEDILHKRGPTSRLGTQAKVYFAAQVDIAPPTIVLHVNDPKLFQGRYERYLLNRLREELAFSEVPIRLVFKKRERVSLQELKQRTRQAGKG